MLHRRLALAAAALVPLLAAPAFADPLEDAVLARQGYFKLVVANAGPLFGMAKGDVAYDAAQAATLAANLKALGSMDIGALFPAGSDSDAMAGKTRALPAIWANFPDVAAKKQGFADATVALDAAAADGLDALRGAVGGLGQACQACHDSYQKKL